MADKVITEPATNEVATKVSSRDFFAMLNIDNRDVVKFSGDSDMIYITVKQRDPVTNEILMRGPSFAQQPVILSHVIALVKPGRPEGTTVANGAKPKMTGYKTSRSKSITDTITDEQAESMN
jgi:hypothetical protein